MPDDFHQKMAEINQRQGKDPIDGTRIEGFGPGTPPVPERQIDIQSAAEQYGEPVETNFAPPPQVSPLLNIARKPPEKPQEAPAAPVTPEAELWIAEDFAAYKNRPVKLLKEERDQVVRIVVRALKRDLDSLEVPGPRVRRARKGKKKSS